MCIYIYIYIHTYLPYTSINQRTQPVIYLNLAALRAPSCMDTGSAIGYLGKLQMKSILSDQIKIKSVTLRGACGN